jgi:pimeloyl-ACP methyl ester carboxylesterase
VPYAVNDRVRLFYSETGEGPAVLGHTGACGDARMWETAGYISAPPGFRHIRFDHRSHGRSDHPDDIALQPMSLGVDDLVAVLDAVGLERSAVVGYSQGGASPTPPPWVTPTGSVPWWGSTHSPRRVRIRLRLAPEPTRPFEKGPGPSSKPWREPSPSRRPTGWSSICAPRVPKLSPAPASASPPWTSGPPCPRSPRRSCSWRPSTSPVTNGSNRPGGPPSGRPEAAWPPCPNWAICRPSGAAT